jgi:hypothetical protein
MLQDGKIANSGSWMTLPGESWVGASWGDVWFKTLAGKVLS